MTTAAAGGGVALRAARPSVRQRSQLRSVRPWLLVVMYAPLSAILLLDSTIDTLDRVIAGVTWVLCLWPAWQFVTAPPERRRPVPFVPLVGIAFGCYFALQIVLGATNLYGRFEVATHAPNIDAALYGEATFLLFVGWLLLLLAHRITSGRIKRVAQRQLRIEEGVLPRLALWAGALLALSLAIEVTKRSMSLPGGVRGILYFLSSLTGVALALLVALAVQKRIDRRLLFPLYGAVALTMFLQASTGASQVVMMTVLTLGMAVVLAGGRLTWRWVALGVAGIALFGAMRGVALEHRRAAYALTAGAPSEGDQSALVFVLIAERIEREGVLATVVRGWEIAMARSALTDLFADVIRQTPSRVPFWGGDTYRSLIGAFVPRALWPDKPTKTLGYEFGHRYGYTRPDDYTTTINMPFLVEFYANFAATGVVIGMFIVGVLYGLLDRFFNRPGQSTLRSLYALALTVPLVNIESDFSLVFGGLFLNGCAMYALLWLARRHRGPTLARANGAGRPEGPAGELRARAS